MVNPVVEQCWKVREKLAKQLGGLDGLFDEVERLDRKRLRAEAARNKTKPASATGKKRSSSKRPKSN